MTEESEARTADDPYHLHRFIQAQEGVYERALSEIRNGRKVSHWMWYIFPQFDGLGFSSMSKRYAIKSLAEARERRGTGPSTSRSRPGGARTASWTRETSSIGSGTFRTHGCKS